MIRARLTEWWLHNSPYWRGYRAGLHAHKQAHEKYLDLQRRIRYGDDP